MKKKQTLFNHKSIDMIFIGVGLVMILLFIYLFSANHLLFHLTAEFLIVIVAVFAAMICAFKRQSRTANTLLRMTPSLIIYAILVYLHNLSYEGMNIFASYDVNLTMQLKAIANLILAIGVLFAMIDTNKVSSTPLRFLIYTVGTSIFVLLVFLGVIPDFVVDSTNTLFKNVVDTGIIGLYVLAIILTTLHKRIENDYKIFYIVLIVGLMLSQSLFFIDDIYSTIYFLFALSVRFASVFLLLYIAIRYNLLDQYGELFLDLIDEKNVQIKLKNQISASYSRLAKSQEIAHVGSWQLDMDADVIWASDEAFKIYGLDVPDDNIIDINYIHSFIIEKDRQMMHDALEALFKENKPYNVRYSINNFKGEHRYINATATLEFDESGTPLTANGVIHDITDLKEQQDKLEYESTHDHLTGAYNRRSFSVKREQFNKLQYLPVSTVIIDINGLKIINDSFGHHIGNEVLKNLSQIITDHLDTDNSFLSRIGGDEFVIIFPNRTKTDTEEYMAKLIKIIESKKIGNINISVAFGIASRTSMDEHFDITLKRAEDEMYLYKISNTQSVRNGIIDALLTTLYEKDYVSQEHSQRVSDYAFLLAKAMNLSDKIVNDIKIAGLLHDIGKITISNEILNKKGKLTRTEYEIIKTHPEKGYRILHSLGTMDIIANYVFQHHEHYNGHGYPKGIRGEDISLEARIISIADSYDAMTSFREYKDQMSLEDAIKEFRRCKGTQFDPELVEVFIKDVLEK